MQCLVLAGVVILALVVESKVLDDVVTPVWSYHRDVGIPAAARIKAEEDEIFASSAVSRISGGTPAVVNAYPYLAGLLISFNTVAGRSVCGATLLTTNRLVTAAQCWYDGTYQAKEFEVVLGSLYLYNQGTRMVTSRVIMHPQYSAPLRTFDIAMIYLTNNVVFSTSIKPAALPSANLLTDTYAGDSAFAVGYGKTTDLQQGVPENTVVRQVTVNVITNTECYWSFQQYVQASTICTSGTGFRGICAGDVGGPLVIKHSNYHVLIGVSSFMSSNGCQLGYPSAYTRVSSAYPFIILHL